MTHFSYSGDKAHRCQPAHLEDTPFEEEDLSLRVTLFIAVLAFAVTVIVLA